MHCHIGFSAANAPRRHFVNVAGSPRKLHGRALRQAQAQVLLRMLGELERTCADYGIIGSCSGRIKSFSSICRKMQSRGISRREVFDAIGLRVVVSHVEDCYRLLAHIQTTYTKIESQSRDYITHPKRNGYQSLHVTVADKDGFLIEIQLRTTAMHEVSESGTAAHSGYKAAPSGTFLCIPEVMTSVRLGVLAKGSAR